MHENKERLTRIGNAILSASRNELYLSMRFFDLALSGLGYQMNLNTATIATDGVNILYNPTYLQRQYVDDMIQLNRTYLHMVLHCLFRHPFHRGDRDPALWDVACDIAVESILDSMEVKTVAMVIPLFREDVYDRLRQECPVFSAERIYQALERQIIPWEEQLDFYKYFRRDDHKFWGAQQEEEQQGSGQGDGAGDHTTSPMSGRRSWRTSGRTCPRRPRPAWRPSSPSTARRLGRCSKRYRSRTGSATTTGGFCSVF